MFVIELEVSLFVNNWCFIQLYSATSESLKFFEQKTNSLKWFSLPYKFLILN